MFQGKSPFLRSLPNQSAPLEDSQYAQGGEAMSCAERYYSAGARRLPANPHVCCSWGILSPLSSPRPSSCQQGPQDAHPCAKCPRVEGAAESPEPPKARAHSHPNPWPFCHGMPPLSDFRLSPPSPSLLFPRSDFLPLSVLLSLLL